ncbi:(2Fe-2S)-binding protein [bacterium]|nr:(2Fe-2S)-binding protein [bacterium]
MPRIQIDGKPVEVPDGLNLIEAARLLNIEIPHYCYHSGLSVVGSCRMCQIELEFNGRKSIALGCNTLAADGMQITTTSDEIRSIRRAVLEFYLQHHPLDCPICDDAGECDLQNYYMEHGLHDSRVDLAEKKHKHKVIDVGPTVVLDSERCILCTRCVRFCREIVGKDQLGVYGHGSDAELMNVPGTKLDNDYAGNVVDLCPVGALTDKDFRFKRRVWYLKRTPSLCTGCSRGCNIFIDWETARSYKDSGRRIQRLKPRYNKMVNEWWICDRGRYSYHAVDAPNRLLMPISNAEEREHGVSINAILARAAAKIEAIIDQNGSASIAVLGSAHSSNEDLFMLKRLFADHLKVQNIDVNLPGEANGSEDQILMKADLAPNRRGAQAIGAVPWGGEGQNGEAILEGAREGEFEILIIVDHDLTQYLGEKALHKLRKHTGYILYLSSHSNGMSEIADDVLPLAMWAERAATYTNFQGRIQRTSQAFDPLGLATPEWKYWYELAAMLGCKCDYETPQEVFNAIGEHTESFKGLRWDDLGDQGLMLTDAPEPAYRKIQCPNPLPAY